MSKRKPNVDHEFSDTNAGLEPSTSRLNGTTFKRRRYSRSSVEPHTRLPPLLGPVQHSGGIQPEGRPEKTRRRRDESLSLDEDQQAVSSDSDTDKEDANRNDRKDMIDYEEEDWEALERRFLPQVEARREANKCRRGVSSSFSLFFTLQATFPCPLLNSTWILINDCFYQTVAETGILERVELCQFMCHKNLTFDLGDQLNFIIGLNGSGYICYLSWVPFLLTDML
jgi:hypothetical protein